MSKELEIIKMFRNNVVLFDNKSNEYIVHNDIFCRSCKDFRTAINAFYSNIKYSL